MLNAMNSDMLTPSPLFVKWLSSNAVQRGATHSSIRIGFTSAEQANRPVESKIFYGRYNKHTKHGRKLKPRCMNCLKEGHITRYCTKEVMCPYCSRNHVADTCDMHGKIPSNCTACARQAKRADPSTDLEKLFLETPRHLHHSPLYPTCPAMIARKAARALNPPPPPTTGAKSSAAPVEVLAEKSPAVATAQTQTVATTTTGKDTNMSTTC